MKKISQLEQLMYNYRYSLKQRLLITPKDSGGEIQWINEEISRVNNYLPNRKED